MTTTNETDLGSTVLKLTWDERRVLQEVLTTALANLRGEVYKTENYDWRQELKQRELLLKAMLGRLPPSRAR